MPRCKILGYAFAMIPVKKWQDFLIRHHMERCPECQNGLATLEDVRGIMIPESQCQESVTSWDGFQAKLKKEKKKEKPLYRSRWRWAYAMAGLVVLVAAAIWVIKTPPFRKSQLEERLSGHFRINYIRIENKPAQAYVYQPQDSNMIIVWAQKNIRGE
jgi:hypothetical protein